MVVNSYHSQLFSGCSKLKHMSPRHQCISTSKSQSSRAFPFLLPCSHQRQRSLLYFYITHFFNASNQNNIIFARLYSQPSLIECQRTRSTRRFTVSRRHIYPQRFSNKWTKMLLASKPPRSHIPNKQGFYAFFV